MEPLYAGLDVSDKKTPNPITLCPQINLHFFALSM
jgi:hypothetical protein